MWARAPRPSGGFCPTQGAARAWSCHPCSLQQGCPAQSKQTPSKTGCRGRSSHPWSQPPLPQTQEGRRGAPAREAGRQLPGPGGPEVQEPFLPPARSGRYLDRCDRLCVSQAFPCVAARGGGGGHCSSAQNLQWLLMASQPHPSPLARQSRPGPAQPPPPRPHPSTDTQPQCSQPFAHHWPILTLPIGEGCPVPAQMPPPSGSLP